MTKTTIACNVEGIYNPVSENYTVYLISIVDNIIKWNKIQKIF